MNENVNLISRLGRTNEAFLFENSQTNIFKNTFSLSSR